MEYGIMEVKMKKVVVKMTYDADIIEVPDSIEKDIIKVQRKFDKWIHDKSVKHDYWIYQDGKKYCPCFRSDAFVEYINKLILDENGEEQAKILEKFVTDYDKSITSIWF